MTYTQLTQEQRYQLYTLLNIELTQTETAGRYFFDTDLGAK
jgi:hypothetical protein